MVCCWWEKIDAATQTVRQKLSSAKATDLLSYMKMLRAENFKEDRLASRPWRTYLAFQNI
jgi:hypothetical protein